ncbi:hypothetical protein [Pandoravirus japonicus]|uniref:BTB domain-containing protein n=1 Tax=Pandoravirus japonicus TaxID=2823154 RepID=A0A811BTQ5_9VIRU|nr:hypothetical protein [Pandoravirus japonicus]
MAQSAKCILADMRHQHCDCLLEVRPCGADESVAPTAILAHRAILARAAYFAALFRHVEPDRVDRRDAAGARVCRAVYLLEMPFDPAALAFVVECLYDRDHLDRAAECADPVDVICAAVFVEAPRYHIRCLVGGIARALLDAVAAERCDGRDAGGARAQLASFVWHTLASGIDPTTKTRLLGRVLGLLAESDREAILAKHADLAPARFYEPPSHVGEAIVEEDGRSWRSIHLAFDLIDFNDGKQRVEWDGMLFTGFMAPTRRGADGICVRIRRAPHSGSGDDRPRAVRIQMAAGYDVLDPVSVGPFSAPFGGRAGEPFIARQAAKYAASGRSLPRDAWLLPDAEASSDPTHLHSLIAVTHRGRSTAAGDLEAYEVVLLIEELDPSLTPC